MPILTVRHLTRYRYRAPVSFGEHRLMFRPRESYDQRLIKSRLVITPRPTELRYMQDVFGNCVGLARFEGASDSLTFESTVRLEHNPPPLAKVDDVIHPYDATLPFAYSAEDMPDLSRSIERHYSDSDRVLEQWARRFVRSDGPSPILNVLADMTTAIHKEFSYARRLDAGMQAPLETLALGSGTCRDFAMLMMEAARSLGLAARFVSGYIYSPRREARADHKGGGHTHAWVRIYLPACGWVEFDPTNGIVGNTDLIRVAVARDPSQALPLYGTYAGAASDYIGMDVEVDVRTESEDMAQLPPQRSVGMAS